MKSSRLSRIAAVLMATLAMVAMAEEKPTAPITQAYQAGDLRLRVASPWCTASIPRRRP